MVKNIRKKMELLLQSVKNNHINNLLALDYCNELKSILEKLYGMRILSVYTYDRCMEVINEYERLF